MYIKKGDIILVHSHNLTAKIIQVGMNIERWRKLDFTPFWSKIYNHAAICIEDGIIAEALPTGITVDLWEYTYEKPQNKDVIIYRPPLSKQELVTLYYEANKYNGVRYQFINFLQYIPKIFFGIWFGTTHKRSEDELYCTEYVALVLNKISNDKLFPKYWKTSPNDIYLWCIKNAKKVGEINAIQ